MFEKEAEEYYEDVTVGTFQECAENFADAVLTAYKDGAEFGYNKAKEEMRGKHNVDWRKIKKTTKGIEQDNSEEIKYRNSNLNYYIKIKLTEEGRIIYKKYYAKYNCEAPKLNIDNEGYAQFQIHDFMHIFGERLFMGATLPCETYCKIQVKEE